MKTATRLATLIVVAAGACWIGSHYTAQAVPPAVPVAKPPRIAFFSMAGLMKDSKHWKAKADSITDLRTLKTKQIIQVRNEANEITNRISLASGLEKTRLEAELKDKAKETEQMEKEAKDELDTLSLKHLREMKAVLQREIAAVIKERQIDVVITYPGNEQHGMTLTDINSTEWLNLFFRATAAYPLHIGDEFDLTRELSRRFDEHFDKAAEKKNDRDDE